MTFSIPCVSQFFLFVSFVTNVSLDAANTRIKSDGVLLEGNAFLNQLVSLLLEEVDLVDIDLLELEVILLKVGNILDDLLENVVSGFSRVVFERCTLRAQQLDLFLVIVEHLAGLFGSALYRTIVVSE